jgi:acyl-coenzyme A thioesterase PaaI-like protein
MSSRRQGFLRHIDVPPAVFRLGINLWPPFRGAGIRVMRVSDDYREIDVRLRMRLFNRNYFGTQFGGSMFAMTDPFFALMMMRNLGRGYVVWDKAAAIRYVAPGRSDLFARFRLPQEAIDAARTATATGERYEPTFTVVVTDRDGQPIAEVDKTLYIRRHDVAGAPANANGQARAATVTS